MGVDYGTFVWPPEGNGLTGPTQQEIPAGVINNVNTTFTLSFTPAMPAALELFLDGLILIQGVDYTLAGNVITMTSAPLFGQVLYAVYGLPAGGAGVITGFANTPNIALAAPAGILSATFIYQIFGTRGAPTLITAAGGFAFAGSQFFSKAYIAGNGGPVVVTANPQIAPGNVDGQELILQGRDAVNTVEFQDGTGLSLNGAWIGGLDSVLRLSWDTVNWVETSRR